ncbi:MAG TPA: hypothetical protein VFC00_18320 [Micromonosporaceae bacterium]|nr:hypothetical protein [Micromonosporaceae bacterium]
MVDETNSAIIVAAAMAGCVNGARWVTPGRLVMRAFGSTPARISTLSWNSGCVSAPRTPSADLLDHDLLG